MAFSISLPSKYYSRYSNLLVPYRDRAAEASRVYDAGQKLLQQIRQYEQQQRQAAEAELERQWAQIKAQLNALYNALSPYANHPRFGSQVRAIMKQIKDILS